MILLFNFYLLKDPPKVDNNTVFAFVAQEKKTFPRIKKITPNF